MRLTEDMIMKGVTSLEVVVNTDHVNGHLDMMWFLNQISHFGASSGPGACA